MNYFKNKVKKFCNIKNSVIFVYMKQTEQDNTYMVIYSDGVTVLDYICASNLNEAKQIAKENAKVKDYGTAYYKVSRCYKRGVRASSGESHWH